MYCPECRQQGILPWQHADDCVEGLKHKVRFLTSLLLWCGAALLLSVVLLMWMAKLIWGTFP